jgi:hypothetical protein
MKNTCGPAYVVPSVYKKRERDREQRKNRTQLYVYNFTKGLFSKGIFHLFFFIFDLLFSFNLNNGKTILNHLYSLERGNR